MRHPAYKDEMTYAEFLAAREAHMFAERDNHEYGTPSWQFFHGRALSYSDMRRCLNGSKLITQTAGQTLNVKPA